MRATHTSNSPKSKLVFNPLHDSLPVCHSDLSRIAAGQFFFYRPEDIDPTTILNVPILFQNSHLFLCNWMNKHSRIHRNSNEYFLPSPFIFLTCVLMLTLPFRRPRSHNMRQIQYARRIPSPESRKQ